MGIESASFIEDLVVTNPLSGDFKSEGDDHLRLLKLAVKNTFPGLAGAFGRVQSKSSSYTVVANDNATLIQAVASITLNLTAAATLGNKHSFVVDATNGEVSIDPAGAELINGLAGWVVPTGSMAFVWCTGTSFTCCAVTKMSPQLITITGNIVFTAANIAGHKEVTAAADLTLPAASAALIGTKTVVHTATTARVRIIPNGTDTIEGLNATYRVPSWTTVELLCVSATGFILLRSAPYAVGQLVPFAVAQTLPGFLPADFAAISRTTFGGLFDLMGTTHGVGDGVNTFNVPDTRGRSLKGAGSGSGVEAVNAAQVDAALNAFTVVANQDKWITGMMVQLTTTGALPGGLSLLTNYWIIRISSTLIKFALTLANAQNGTVQDFTTQGTGIHTLTYLLSARSAGGIGGEEAHALSSTEDLAHIHGVTDPTHTHGENAGASGGAGNVVMAPSANVNSAANVDTVNTTDAAGTGISVQNFGGNAAMNNESPYGVAQFYVKT